MDYYEKTRTFKTEDGRRRREFRPKDEWIEIRTFSSPIIDEALYEVAQEQLGRPPALNTKQPYLLTKFVFCGECGTTLSGASKMGKTRHYRCRATAKTSVEGATCKASYIKADLLESLAWSEVVNTLKDPSTLVQDLRQFLTSGDGNINEELLKLKKEIDELRRQEIALAKMAMNPNFDPEVVGAQNAPILSLRKEKEREKAAIEAQQSRRDEAAEIESQLLELCRNLAESINSISDSDRKREVLAAFGVKILATKEEIKITATVNQNLTHSLQKITTIARTSA